MSESQQHEMKLVATHPSGAEEWVCPACGRRFLMCWPPAYRKVVLEAGDEYALHTASKGGLKLGSPGITVGADQEDEPHVPDELRAEIEDLLKDIDFESW